MGILRNGLFGGFEKRTGPLVGRMLRGQNVVSMVQHKSLRPISERQRDQRLKFAAVLSFLSMFRGLIKIGFAQFSRRRRTSAFNAAVHFNFENIIGGIAPDYVIDPSKVVYSKGNLALPNTPSFSIEAGRISFNWLPDVQNRYNRNTDMAVFAIYDPVKKLLVTSAGMVCRSALTFSLQLPDGFGADQLHCYMSFISADGRAVSDSIYLKV